jgi:hypothetical protein
MAAGAFEQSSCGNGEICAPKLSTKPCLFKDGDEACPGAPWTAKHLLYRNTRDERACTPCACGSVVGGQCTPTVTAYANSGCTGTSASAVITSCRTGAFPAHLRGTVDLTSAGACALLPDGGRPTGSVVPIDPITVCCSE